MYYLFFQIWIWLLIAFASGWIAHWLLASRDGDNEGSADAETQDEIKKD